MTAPGRSFSASAIAPIMPSPLTAATISPAPAASPGELAGMVEVAGVAALDADPQSPQCLLGRGGDARRLATAGGWVDDQANGG